MAAMNDETTGQRHRIRTEAGNNYMWISDESIMITVADENDIKNAQERAYIESNCRIASKAMAQGVSMMAVAEQMEKADAGRCSLLGKMAQIMREYCEERK